MCAKRCQFGGSEVPSKGDFLSKFPKGRGFGGLVDRSKSALPLIFGKVACEIRFPLVVWGQFGEGAFVVKNVVKVGDALGLRDRVGEVIPCFRRDTVKGKGYSGQAMMYSKKSKVLGVWEFIVSLQLGESLWAVVL